MCVKETFPRDVSFMHTNYLFDREKHPIIIIFESIYFYIFSPYRLIRTLDISNKISSPYDFEFSRFDCILRMSKIIQDWYHPFDFRICMLYSLNGGRKFCRVCAFAQARLSLNKCDKRTILLLRFSHVMYSTEPFFHKNGQRQHHKLPISITTCIICIRFKWALMFLTNDSRV